MTLHNVLVFRSTKLGWPHRRQTSLTQAYINLFTDTTGASILVGSTLRYSLSIYIFFVYNTLFSRDACFFNSTPDVTYWIAIMSVRHLQKSPYHDFTCQQSEITWFPFLFILAINLRWIWN
jgi:hypothetical protein